jgi:hypothetical protein
MSNYSLAFATKLSEVAESLNDGIEHDLDSARTSLYLSRLSIEIALKAALEKAGVKERNIRGRSHNLIELLNDITKCEIDVEISTLAIKRVKATGIRAITIRQENGVTTVGAIIDAEDQGASKYPNNIRYGNDIIDYPPQVVAACSKAVVAWVKLHWNTIRNEA